METQRNENQFSITDKAAKKSERTRKKTPHTNWMIWCLPTNIHKHNVAAVERARYFAFSHLITAYCTVYACLAHSLYEKNKIDHFIRYDNKANDVQKKLAAVKMPFIVYSTLCAFVENVWPLRLGNGTSRESNNTKCHISHFFSSAYFEFIHQHQLFCLFQECRKCFRFQSLALPLPLPPSVSSSNVLCKYGEYDIIEGSISVRRK